MGDSSLAWSFGLINAVQTTMYALAAHVYPAGIRATGAGTAVAIGRVGGVGSSYEGAWALESGPSQMFRADRGVARDRVRGDGIGAEPHSIESGRPRRAVDGGGKTIATTVGLKGPRSREIGGNRLTASPGWALTDRGGCDSSTHFPKSVCSCSRLA